MGTTQPGPEDLLLAARVTRTTLSPALGRNWSVKAGDLEWSCLRTLDHIPDALLLYAGHLATGATERLPFVRNGDPTATPATGLVTVESAAAVLAAVIREAPEDRRAFHPAGMADGAGFAAMGCTEILLHTADIAQGLGVEFAPPDDLCERVVRRIFPWAPEDVAPWAALQWAGGRIALEDRPRLDADWYWHPAPLSEWDGSIKRRSAPPAWR